MPEITVKITIDSRIKKKADPLLAECNMSISEAVELFLQQIIYEGTIPFTSMKRAITEETSEAMRESEMIRRYAKSYRSYVDSEEMLEVLLREA